MNAGGGSRTRGEAPPHATESQPLNGTNEVKNRHPVGRRHACGSDSPYCRCVKLTAADESWPTVFVTYFHKVDIVAGHSISDQIVRG